jgi:hypothetical protein
LGWAHLFHPAGWSFAGEGQRLKSLPKNYLSPLQRLEGAIEEKALTARLKASPDTNRQFFSEL